jgi:hypothetical protein
MIYKDSEHISFFNRYRVLKVLHKSLNHNHPVIINYFVYLVEIKYEDNNFYWS